MWEERFAIDVTYAHRAAFVTLASSANLGLAMACSAVYGRQIRAVGEVAPPLLPFDLHVGLADGRDIANGVEFDLVARVVRDGACVWESRAATFARTRASEGSKAVLAPEPAWDREVPAPIAGNAGRIYAKQAPANMMNSKAAPYPPSTRCCVPWVRRSGRCRIHSVPMSDAAAHATSAMVGKYGISAGIAGWAYKSRRTRRRRTRRRA